MSIFIILLFCVHLWSGTISAFTSSVTWNSETRTYAIQNGKSVDYVAFATFKNDVNTTGWAYLEVYTNGSYPDEQQAYAAGLVEGHVSRDLIAMSWQNTFANYCTHPLSPFCKHLQVYLNDNMQWVVKQIRLHALTDPYWHQVELYLNQMSGLQDGYHNKPGIPKYYIDVTGINIIQIEGDLEDLTEALEHQTGHPRNGHRLRGPLHQRVTGSGRCSALIKVLAEHSELYVAQVTWNGYNSMLRVLKKYQFSYHTTQDSKQMIAGNVMTFSSYPGVITSGDDFYTISTGLVAIETTIGNSNEKLWQYVKPEGAVLEGIRNMVANRLAKSGRQWCDVFSKFNSGTYNNEWMIVDYNLFKPHAVLPTQDLLWVLEQIPGMIVKKDLTSTLLERSYFASYNSPCFPEIFNASGCWANVKKFGDWFTYNHTPRANIFRRDHSKVQDIESMSSLMRYNDFTHDPLSQCNCTPPYSAENAISARNDLNPASGHYPFPALGHRSHGGIDMKMTSHELMQSLEFEAISSPAYDNVPPFQWSKSDFAKTVSHIGHPDKWTFPQIRHKWGTATS